jgi:succinate dehydrogenase/fumarate reductase flavoprotein subunit
VKLPAHRAGLVVHLGSIEGGEIMDSETEVISLETDVLIIGGGLAGCMAAIKASEYDVSVTIAEKANTLASGCAGSGIDHMWSYIPPVHEKMGYTLEDLIESHTKGIANGFINGDLIHFIARESYNRMLDLERFGLTFRYEDSKVPGNFRIVPQFHSEPSAFNFDGRDVKVNLTEEAKKRGVNIINRVTVVELLSSSDGHVSGALGVGTRDGKLYFFKAKAVVLSTGRVNRLSRSVTGVWGNHRIPVNETGDGRAMAFRAGIPLINMEFLSPANFSIGNFEINLGSPRNTTQPAGSIVDANGEIIVPRTSFYNWEGLGKEKVKTPSVSGKQVSSSPRALPNYFQLHNQGKGPFYLDLTGGTEEEIRYIEWSISHEGKGFLFLDYLKNQENFDFRRDTLEWLPNSREMAGTAASGLIVNNNLETGMKGLFAAGDEVGGVPWSASPGAFTMGWHAGEMAAKEAMHQKVFLDVPKDKISALRELYHGVFKNKQGLHWREIEMAVQNIVDHYAGNVRAERMLMRGIEHLKNIKENVSFTAENPHEVGRCLEVMSVIDNADMVLRASLERKESRPRPFGFFRADFPEENDEDYFAFISMRLNKNQIEFSKIPL